MDRPRTRGRPVPPSRNLAIPPSPDRALAPTHHPVMTPHTLMMVRAGIFAAAYAAISFQGIPKIRLNRPAAALVGAALMVTLGRLPLAQAYAAVDMNVIVFLLGLMLVVGYLEEARFFEWLAGRIVERAT